MSKISDSILSLLAPKAEKALFSMKGVTVFGDSIMHGIVPHLKANFPEDFAIHSLTIPGDTARNAWLRFPYTLRSNTAVIIEHGTNDLTIGLDPLPYIKKMVDYAVKEGRSVFLTGVLPRADRSVDQINREIAMIASKNPHQVHLLATALFQINYPNYVLSDGLHPDAETSRLLAGYIASGMKYSAPQLF